jgi:hypothetical protein
LRCRGIRTEHREPRGTQRIGDTGDQRSFRANDHQADIFAPSKLDDSAGIAWVDRDALSPPRNPRITGRGQQLVTARRLPKAPGERILATA